MDLKVRIIFAGVSLADWVASFALSLLLVVYPWAPACSHEQTSLRWPVLPVVNALALLRALLITPALSARNMRAVSSAAGVLSADSNTAPLAGASIAAGALYLNFGMHQTRCNRGEMTALL
eukprot:6601103-Pyramimonas_sp.AAC.1